MTNRQYWIGFDLGGTKMLATLFDDDLQKVSQVKRKTKSESGEFGSDRIIETIQKLFDGWNGKPASVQGIGIGVPGALDLATGEIISAPNLGWKNVALKTHLEDVFRLPVAIINDVDAGTYGEYITGAAKNARCVLGVFPGTGIGGGCVYEGNIMRGATASAVEIGHLQVDKNGFRCGCGNRGCLETVASRLAIAAQASIAAYRGQAPALFAQTGCDITKIKSGAIAAAITAGDSAIEDIVRHAARALGQGIATAVNLVAPDIILLGGGLVEKMATLFQEEVIAGMEPSLFPVYRNTFRVTVAQLGDDAVSLGAAANVKKVINLILLR